MSDVPFTARPEEGWQYYESSIEWRVVDGNPQYRYTRPDQKGYEYYDSALTSQRRGVGLW